MWKEIMFEQKKITKKRYDILSTLMPGNFVTDYIKNGVVKLIDDTGMMWDLNERQNDIICALAKDNHYVYSVLDQNITDGNKVKHVTAYLYCDAGTSADITVDGDSYKVKAFINGKFKHILVRNFDNEYIHI